MQFKVIDLSDLEKIDNNHAVIIISDGKMKLAELPAYGNIEIFCHEKRVKQVKEMKTATF